VSSVTPGSPAFRDGRIRPGDRILAINGQRINGVNERFAEKLIGKSGAIVRFVLSQAVVSQSSGVDSEYGRISRAGESRNRHGSDDPGRYADFRDKSDRYASTVPRRDDRLSSGGYGRDPHDLSWGGGGTAGKTFGSAYERASVDSSDLELEDVIPMEALRFNSGHGVMNKQSLQTPGYISDSVGLLSRTNTVVKSDKIGVETRQHPSSASSAKNALFSGNHALPTMNGNLSADVGVLSVNSALTAALNKDNVKLNPKQDVTTTHDGDELYYEIELKKINDSLGLNIVVSDMIVQVLLGLLERLQVYLVYLV